MKPKHNRENLLKALSYENLTPKMLMKLTPAVNFINVKRTNFSYKRRVSAAFSNYMYVEKRCSFEKFAHKMLMKLTPVLSNKLAFFLQSPVGQESV
jgi:hypothetical protein